METLSGSYVAIVTPWTDDGSAIDFDRLRGLVEYQVAHGTDGIIPAGTTGESATLTHDEQRALVEKTVEFVGGRAKVFAGAGSNSTAEAVSLVKRARQAGADGALVITPYYNRPTPEGLYRHFMAVAEAADLPIMLYNVPSRTGTNMLPDTVVRLRRANPRFAAVKEASGGVEQAGRILEECDIAVFSGDDALTLPMMALGAVGVVSVAANVHPGAVKALVDAANAGDLARARAKHFELLPLFRNLFAETNPAPAKACLRRMGRTSGTLRLPLVPVSPATERLLADTLAALGLDAAEGGRP